MVNIFAGNSSSPAEKEGPGEAKDLFTYNYGLFFFFFNSSECTSHCWPVRQNITLRIGFNGSPRVLPKPPFKNLRINKWENKCHI